MRIPNSNSSIQHFPSNSTLQMAALREDQAHYLKFYTCHTRIMVSLYWIVSSHSFKCRVGFLWTSRDWIIKLKLPSQISPLHWPVTQGTQSYGDGQHG